ATAVSLRQLIMWRFVQGLATPGIFAGTVAYIHEEWPAARAGRATAAYMTGTIIGGFTGRVVAGLVAADVNWHASFIALAILNLALASALFAWLPPERSVRSAGLSGPRSAALKGPPYTAARDVVHLFQNRQLVATSAFGFCVL